MSEVICTGGICTACGACENICPKQCVKRENAASSITMIKGESCIGCGLCDKVCPGNSEQMVSEPITAYAAFSSDPKTREKSASGGIASTLYKFCIEMGYTVVGAVLGADYECHLKIADRLDQITGFQNSKYTYSFTDQVYREVKCKLDKGKAVFFIGLPCQVAAVRSYLNTTKTKTDLFVAADIICHGTPHPDYLPQHVKAVANRGGFKAGKLFFRDPRYKTSKFAFTIYDESIFAESKFAEAAPKYKKYVEDDDLYQIGYHSALIYRDPCYSCKYAQLSRGGDLTFGDYHVKSVDDCDIDTEKKSLILVNSEKGQELLQPAVKAGVVAVIERPVEEPKQGEPQLRHPSVAGPERAVFITEYAKTHDFDRAASIAFKKIVFRRRLKIDKIIFSAKMAVKKIVPKSAYKKAKQMIKGS